MKPYLDDIGSSLAVQPEPACSILATQVIPRLLNFIADDHKLQVRVGHDLQTVTDFLAAERRKDVGAVEWFTMYDAECWPEVDPDDALFCYLVDGEEIVGSIGSRLYRCERSLGDSLQSLRLFYADPERMAEPGEQCLVTADHAFRTGKAIVAFNCAGYIVKRLRETPLYGALSRLCRIATLIRWPWDYLVALIEEGLARKISFTTYGHQAAYPHVLHRIPGRIVGEDVCQLMVSERKHMERILCRPEAGDMAIPLLRANERRWIEARTA